MEHSWPFTFDHDNTAGTLARAVGERLGLDDEDLDMLAAAGGQDIPAPLTEDERDELPPAAKVIDVVDTYLWLVDPTAGDQQIAPHQAYNLLLSMVGRLYDGDVVEALGDALRAGEAQR